MSTDKKYLDLLWTIINTGDRLVTRNSRAFSCVDGLQVSFLTCPLVTIRKTAWKKALVEMEWFMSGKTECPEKLLDWWSKQLNPSGNYLCGYPTQLRNFTCDGGETFDQMSFLLEAIKAHPNSRRLITTTWNPAEMSLITTINQNKDTPTCCHGTLNQFFVRDGSIHLHTFQRSADMLLGVPHNWIQYWALMTFLAHHSNLEVGRLVWTFGDAHVYDEKSHLDCVNELSKASVSELENRESPTLKYEWSGKSDSLGFPTFLASDFSLEWPTSAPVALSTIRPTLL